MVWVCVGFAGCVPSSIVLHDAPCTLQGLLSLNRVLHNIEAGAVCCSLQSFGQWDLQVGGLLT